MQNTFITAAAVGLLGFLVSAASVPVTEPAPTSNCKLRAAAAVTPREGEQELRLTVDGDVDGAVTAEFAPNAGITVNSADLFGDNLTLRIEAAAATAGTHKLTLRAGGVECTGDVKVLGDTQDAG